MVEAVTVGIPCVPLQLGRDAEAGDLAALSGLERLELDLRGKLVFPVVLNEQYWVDKSSGFATTRYLGVREMKL